MPVVHCPGHEFRLLTWARDRATQHGWVCKICSLKVTTAKARKYFEGKSA